MNGYSEFNKDSFIHSFNSFTCHIVSPLYLTVICKNVLYVDGGAGCEAVMIGVPPSQRDDQGVVRRVLGGERTPP